MKFKPHPLKPRLASGKREANRFGKKTQKEENKRFSRNFGKKTEGKKITKSNRQNHPIFRPPLTTNSRSTRKPSVIGSSTITISRDGPTVVVNSIPARR